MDGDDEPTANAMPSDQLRVLSFNCWGLKFFSRNRTERIPAIAAKLAQSNYDIIALQELWVHADFELIKKSVASKLGFARFFYSGALGAGLAILSRYPIIETSVHPYSLNGAPIDVAAGDWFVGKAAASIVIQHPVLDQVQIFNTHLYAKGGDDGPEHIRAHRLVNAWEFARLARQAAELGRYVIAAGDFNSIPTALPMTIIRDYAALDDCWSVTHHTASNTSLAPTNQHPPLDAIQRFGITADSPQNTYSAGKPLDLHAREHFGKRLDYIFYRQPIIPNVPEPSEIPVLKCTHSKVVFTDTIPGYNFSFSDHFGLEATFEFPKPDDDSDNDNQSRLSIAGQSRSRFPALSPATVKTTIQGLTACYRYSRHRSSRELAVFCICIAILVALIVSSAWLPKSWINSLFLLFTIFISWLATTMLYEGFIYGRWELNALMNAIEDLEVYQKAADARVGTLRGW